MPHVDYQNLISPVSPDGPCGEDLDLTFDPAYMNFMASAEGLLPSSYFVKDQNGNERPFDRTVVDLKAQFEAAKPFLEKTRDLQLLALLAKFAILDRDLEGFIACVRAISTLVAERWDEVHPRVQADDFTPRMVALESIDVLPTVIIPLQFQPLIEHRRYGQVTYRNYLIAAGEIAPREGEDRVEMATIEKAVDETDLPAMIERRTQLTELRTAVDQIPKTWQGKSGSDGSVSLQKLAAAIDKMVTFLDKAVAKRNPAAALRSEDLHLAEAPAAQLGTALVTVGSISSVADAAAALAGAAQYFSKFEPSSPALLLALQAKELVGKSFLEVMRVLIPHEVERAMVNIGGDQSFDLPIERLSPFSPERKPPQSVEPQNQFDSQSETPQSQEQGGTAAMAEATITEWRPLIGDAVTGAFAAHSRSEALALLELVGSYFRSAEPSSPIPFLTERARDLAQRDFLSILKVLLPTGSLKSDASGS